MSAAEFSSCDWAWNVNLILDTRCSRASSIKFYFASSAAGLSANSGDFAINLSYTYKRMTVTT